MWTDVKDSLPPLGIYVLVHLKDQPWLDSTDPDGVFHDVVKLVKQDWYMPNNKGEHIWQSFGPASYFEQDVDRWTAIPGVD